MLEVVEVTVIPNPKKQKWHSTLQHRACKYQNFALII